MYIVDYLIESFKETRTERIGNRLWVDVIEEGSFFPNQRAHDREGYQLYDIWHKYLKKLMITKEIYTSEKNIKYIIDEIGPYYPSTYSLCILIPHIPIKAHTVCKYPDEYVPAFVYLMCGHLAHNKDNDLNKVFDYLYSLEIRFSHVQFALSVISACEKEYNDVFQGAHFRMKSSLMKKLHDWYSLIDDDMKALGFVIEFV